jgi:hypothetical protein
MMSLSSSLIDSNTIYRFRLAYQNFFISSITGILGGSISLNPSARPEYGTLELLFGEVRVIKAVLHVVPLNPHSDGYAAGTNRFGIPFAYNPTETNTSPSSLSDVWQNATCKVMHLASSSAQIIVANVKGNSFALTGTPVPGPYAGCYGQFEFYQTGLSASTTYFEFYLEVEYEFRGRN